MKFEPNSDGRRSNEPREVASLTGIRGVAAISVVIYHALIGAARGSPVSFRGAWAVDLFFVLSGFVMSLTYLRQETVDWRRFFASRFARIYPLYGACSLVMMGLLLYGSAVHHEPLTNNLNFPDVFRHLTLTMAMPLVGGGEIWNDPTWSISVEWWVYLTVFWILARAKNSISAKVSTAATYAMILTLIVYLSNWPSANDFTRGWPAFARASVGFISGWCAYRLSYERNLQIPPLITDLVALSSVVAIVWAGLLQTDAWWLVAVYPILVMGLASSGSGTARFLSSVPMHRIGLISYSLYLTHPIALWVLGRILPRLGLVDNALVAVSATLVLTFCLSELTFTFIEKPGRLLLRRALSR